MLTQIGHFEMARETDSRGLGKRITK